MRDRLIVSFFPTWSPEEIIRQAVSEYNSPNLDAAQSMWGDLFPVVRAFLRHRFTNYDDVCRLEPDRYEAIRRRPTGL
jgi:hypothetical protein